MRSETSRMSATSCSMLQACRLSAAQEEEYVRFVISTDFFSKSVAKVRRFFEIRKGKRKKNGENHKKNAKKFCQFKKKQ